MMFTFARAGRSRGSYLGEVVGFLEYGLGGVRLFADFYSAQGMR